MLSDWPATGPAAARGRPPATKPRPCSHAAWRNLACANKAPLKRCATQSQNPPPFHLQDWQPIPCPCHWLL
eukprot:3365156-Lingulodinium_polyedra.AAC.1